MQLDFIVLWEITFTRVFTHSRIPLLTKYVIMITLLENPPERMRAVAVLYRYPKRVYTLNAPNVEVGGSSVYAEVPSTSSNRPKSTTLMKCASANFPSAQYPFA